VESCTQNINVVYDSQIDNVYTGEDKLGGERVAFSSLFGADKPIISNFWTGLCPPCRAKMPDFQAAF
jgi:thiol-disulfide isomerase/thioredoxin